MDDLVRRCNVPAAAGQIPVDLLWTVDDKTVMGDRKAVPDLIASANDGRLHEQVAAMEGKYGFILLEGEVSKDGYTVGEGDHCWQYDQFDDLLLSLQEEGVKVIHSPGKEMTARRLAAVYKRLNSGDRGSWHLPVRLLPPAQDYLDAEYRERVGMLMHLGKGKKGTRGMGPVMASEMLSNFGLMGTLGITEDSLNEAIKRWKTVKGAGKTLVERWGNLLRE